jgi:hypothetical protein
MYILYDPFYYGYSDLRYIYSIKYISKELIGSTRYLIGGKVI